MLWLRTSLAASALCAATSALALDHPYAAPASVPAPATAARASQYWSYQANRYNPDSPEAVPAEVGHDRIAVLEAAATLTSPDVCSQPTATDTIYGVRVCIERDGDLDPRIHCRDFPFELAVTFVRQ